MKIIKTNTYFKEVYIEILPDHVQINIDQYKDWNAK